MNKEEISLTWKYFWKQKKKEIAEALRPLFYMWLVLGWVFGMCFTIFAFEDGFIVIYNGNWWAFIPIALWSTHISVIIIIIFISWIESNWKKAKKKAKAEVRNSKLKRKEYKK